MLLMLYIEMLESKKLFIGKYYLLIRIMEKLDLNQDSNY